MKQAYALLLLFVAIAQVCLTAAGSNDVVTENLKLYVGGAEYFIKAICYSPVPLGLGVQQSNGDVGGGYCSEKITPYGNNASACYDSDYFDGGSNAVGLPTPPQGGWFQSTWARDFPIMQAMGANTLRLYSANPTTKQASIYFPETVVVPLGKDHVPFMDMAQQYGFKVIFPLISDYGMMTTYTAVEFKRLLRFQIDELGNHPALLMWAFGNELPLDASNPTFVSLLNSYIAFIRQYTYAKWGRRVPVTCAVVDNPSSYDYLASALDVDVFTSNAGYRGTSLTDLWSGNSQTLGWAKLSCRYNKPLFIGEINYPSLNNAISYSTPNWFNQIWQDVVNHIDQGCIGGAFFEYSDEPLKADALQQTMGVVSFSVSTSSAGSSTQEFVWNTDIATQKPEVYNQVASGSVNGILYNMNSNPFSLIGRVQSLLTNAAPICGAYAFTQCPGSNVCSYNGLCDGSTGACTCNPGWSGADCSQPTCSNGCSGRGQCSTTVSPPVCSCSTGWIGADCSVQLTQSTCATYCAAGNGQCSSSGACVCYKGWLGTDCSIPDTSYPPANSTATTAPTAAPTTQAPTAAPTTVAPTTAAPTTIKASTTVAPTAAPTTAAPTTAAPTTAAPTTAAPTKAPTTAAPTTAAPTTAAPTTVKAPTVAPTTAPTTAAPTTVAPTAAPTAAQNSSCFVQCGPTLSCCGYACYLPAVYGCVAAQLCQLGQPGCTGGSTAPTSAPSTAAPSTAAPSTAAPTTTVKAVPTQQPSTAAPTTVKPTAAPSTAAPSTAAPTTVKPTAVPTAKPTVAATTAPTTVQPTVAATTAPTTTQAAPSATTTQQANSACGSMSSCGLACYNPQSYTCFDGFLCTNPNQRCGQACYDPSGYTCVNNQIVAL